MQTHEVCISFSRAECNVIPCFALLISDLFREEVTCDCLSDLYVFALYENRLRLLKLSIIQ